MPKEPASAHIKEKICAFNLSLILLAYASVAIILIVTHKTQTSDAIYPPNIITPTDEPQRQEQSGYLPPEYKDFSSNIGWVFFLACIGSVILSLIYLETLKKLITLKELLCSTFATLSTLVLSMGGLLWLIYKDDKFQSLDTTINNITIVAGVTTTILEEKREAQLTPYLVTFAAQAVIFILILLLAHAMRRREQRQEDRETLLLISPGSNEEEGDFPVSPERRLLIN